MKYLRDIKDWRELKNEVILGDCLEGMKMIPDKSIDAVICDPPYGTTACSWDSIIPFEPMWEQLKRITKKNGAIVLFGSQPFTSALVMSNLKMFRYEWVWDKKLATGHLNANKMPMRRHENIVVFSNGKSPYNPIMRAGKMRERGGGNASPVYGKCVPKKSCSDQYYPTSIIEIHNAGQTRKTHSTQKPVALMQYLVKTYSFEGDIVLDFTAGSFTTARACKDLGRDFIGFELEEDYCKIGEERLRQQNLF